jgi:hypothetical protein
VPQNQIQSLTDEGYGSLTHSSAQSTKPMDPHLDDNQTVYSDTPSANDPQALAYNLELARDLCTQLLGDVPDGNKKKVADRILDMLENVLKGFALKVGCGERSQLHRDIMAYTHKHRR